MSLEQDTDRALLQRGDDTAYEELIRRHGRQVFNVCRRGLGDSQDAEDTAHAAFLALAHHAHSIKDISVAGWLHRVAWRLTLNARKAAATRRTHEQEAAVMKERSKSGSAEWPAVEEILDGELDALPEKYRLPIILHLIEGESIEDGAQRLGWNSGTFASRLGRGKDLLRDKLTRRGVTLSVALLAGMIGENANTAALPAHFTSKAARAASLTAAGAGVQQLASSDVARVLQDLRVSSLAKLKLAAAVLVLLGIFCSATVAVMQRTRANELANGPASAPLEQKSPPMDIPELKSPQLGAPANSVSVNTKAHELPAPAVAPSPVVVGAPREPKVEPNNGAAEARGAVSGLKELVDEIAPLYGTVRPPYDLARHDLGLNPQKSSLADLTAQASERQTRLELAWGSLQKSAAGQTLNATEQAHMALLSYAFGSGTVEQPLAAARKAGRMEQLRVARLLLTECQFNPAIEELIDVAKSDDKAATLAQAILVQHAVERHALASRVRLLPLRTDLDKYVADCRKDPRWAAFVESIEKSAKTKLPPELVSSDTEMVVPPDILSHAELGDHFELFVGNEIQLNESSLKDVYLETEGGNFSIAAQKNAQGYVKGNSAVVNVHTAYHGPLGFKLFYFDKEAEWKAFNTDAVARTKPERSWEQTLHPLRANNHLAAVDEELAVGDLRSGYYMILAEARYAPCVVALKFAVSNVAVYLRAARNQVTAAAVDRSTGQPAAGLSLELTIDGTPLLPPCPPEISTDAEKDAFRIGFFDLALAPPAGAGYSEEYLAQVRASAIGHALRKNIPDIHRTLSGKTGADGCWTPAVDLSDRAYRYTVLARNTGATPVDVQVSYSEAPEAEKIKILAWASQPIYRPGDEAQFKGVVRRFDRSQPIAYSRLEKESVAVEIKSNVGTLWHGVCPLSPAGTFHGAFKIPTDVKFGDYNVSVNGEVASPGAVFSVEEFRLPTFRLDATMAQISYGGGQTADGRVQVCYFSGKPVAGTPVEVVLETGELEPKTITVNTDETGTAHFHFPVPALQGEQYLTVRATAIDASGQSYTCSSGFHAQPTAYYLQATCLTPSLIAGEMAEVCVTASNWQGRPVPDVQVVAEGFNSIGKTGPDGKAVLKLKTQSYAYSQEFKICSLGENQTAWCTASVSLVNTRGADTAHRDYLSVNVPRAPTQNSNEIDAGDPLKLQIDTDREGGGNCFVVVFVEGMRNLHQRAMILTPGKHDIEIPTSADFAPQCRVESVLLTGKNILTQSNKVFVRPVQRMLSVEVTTEKQEYRPAERCVAQILVLDHARMPVANAEVSLGVVQSPVYEVREDPTPDMQSYFYHFELPAYAQSRYDFNGGDVYETLQFSKGPKYTWGYSTLFGSSSGSGSGSGHGSFGSRSGGGRRLMVMRHGGSKATSSSAQDLHLRENFKSNAHWIADLVTDANGKAQVEFLFPDDITEWRFTARSLTQETLVGEVRIHRQTLLPLQAELILPRALRDGDRVKVAAMIHENANRGRTVSASATCGATPTEKELVLKPHDSVRLEVPVEPTSTGELRLTAGATDGATGDTDASARTMTVLPRGHHVAANYSGIAKDGGTVSLDLGASLRPGLEKVTVRLEPGFSGVVSSAVGNLIDYPYGCMEQTMSRFMPATIAARALKQAKLPNPNESKLKDVFAKSFNRMAGFQHTDGGWGWWQQDRTNDFMTAYVVEGLSLCAGAGREIPGDMLQRAVTYLENALRNDSLDGHFRLHSVQPYNIRIYTAHALATYYSLDAKAHAPQFEDLQKLAADQDLAKQAESTDCNALLWADTLRMLGKREQAAALIGTVAGHFHLANDRGSLLTAALLLEAGRGADPENPRWIELARNVVSRRHGAYWMDTQVTAGMIRGLCPFLSAGPGPSGSLTLFADGKPAGTLNTTENESASLSLSREIAGAKSISIKSAGDVGDCFWSARVEGYRVNPPEAPEKPAVTVACRIFKDNAEIVATNDAVAVSAGVTYKVRLECDLKEAVNCTRITFPRPCGVELVGVTRLNKQNIVAMEDHDDAAHFFIDGWEAGFHTVEFFVRAEVEGEVFAPLPEFEPMYGGALPIDIKSPTKWVISK